MSVRSFDPNARVLLSAISLAFACRTLVSVEIGALGDVGASRNLLRAPARG